MGIMRAKLKIFIAYVFLSSFIISEISLNAAEYQIIDLQKRAHPWDKLVINNNGLIAGQHRRSDGTIEAYVFDVNTYDEEYLGYLGIGTKVSFVFDINNNDEVYGFSYAEVFDPNKGRINKIHPFIWTKEKGKTDISSFLGDCALYSYNCLTSNDSNQLAGFGFGILNKIRGSLPKSSFIINKKTGSSSLLNFPENIEPGYSPSFMTRVNAINNDGNIAGSIIYPVGSYHEGAVPGSKSFSFYKNSKNSSILKLNNPSGREHLYSIALDINEHDEIVGASEIETQNFSGRYFWHACLWIDEVVLDIGTLEEDDDSVAQAINSRGFVVGYSGLIGLNSDKRGFIWDPTNGMRDLNTLINNRDYQIIQATDINDNGQIAAYAKINGVIHAILLNPIE